LINIIATSPQIRFLKVKHYSREVKDAKFIVDILIKDIEQVGPAKVLQVMTDNALVCKAASLIVEKRYDHIF
jgi:hypothetical protein